MANKTKRVTAASVVWALLERATRPSDEAIIKEVKAKSGSKKFDGRQLAWYKSQYNTGKMPKKYGKARKATKRSAPEREAVAA